ncbi:ribonuclease-3 family protein [Paenibacillus sp. UNC496MF]|uniref:Mini-ribonuclease 3 n=1 Tax=Paenibacillus sp. UNC496MF TaxID=1502753 RepID=UPI0008EAC409|nr:Mini-ribonuclease 3 [Paenibacillus sp. UNC496MF]SFJ88739.1 ribonuclease-3 family protein [Paenibacillus sp. UNC496MF]
MTGGPSEGPHLWFHEPTKPIDLVNPIVLAYIGDAVYEVLVRQYLISLPNHRPHHLHREATKFVSAKAQFHILEKWRPHLTEAEADIVRRGRNAKSGTMPKNADPAHYKQATALECLVGYLYYGKQVERLRELMAIAFGETDEAADGGTTKENQDARA